MKLCEKLNRRVGDKEYKKWYLVLSKEDIDKLQWKKGEELEAKVRGNSLMIRPE